MKTRVLVVDDEAQLTELLKECLQERFACEVTIFNDPTDAFVSLQLKEYDVISVDHRMPRLTGMALLKLLRTTPGPNQHVPTLIFTGYIEEAKSEHMAIFDNVLFLEKPVKVDRFLNNIRLALEMKKQNPAA